MNALNKSGMCFEGLDNHFEEIHTQYYEFFNRKTYDWWYEVKEGDICLDIGSCIGMFTCLALDKGASKVYAVEPNPTLLRTTMKNAFPHICNREQSPVIPINAFIGTDRGNAFGAFDESQVPSLSFMELIEKYNIDYIDYLKIDCEGGEYDILTKENLEWIKANVKHMVVEVHIDTVENSEEKFRQFRKDFLYDFEDYKIRFCKEDAEKKTYADEWDWASMYPSIEDQNWGKSWLIFICNKSLEHRKHDFGPHLHGSRNG